MVPRFSHKDSVFCCMPRRVEDRGRQKHWKSKSSCILKVWLPVSLSQLVCHSTGICRPIPYARSWLQAKVDVKLEELLPINGLANQTSEETRRETQTARWENKLTTWTDRTTSLNPGVPQRGKFGILFYPGFLIWFLNGHVPLRRVRALSRHKSNSVSQSKILVLSDSALKTCGHMVTNVETTWMNHSIYVCAGI